MVIAESPSDTDQSQRSRRRLTAILLSLLALILVVILVLLLVSRNSSTPKNDLAISYRYPTTTLDWSGFKIHASSCRVVTGSSGFVSARVNGTAVVPDDGPDFVVVGQVETWILNASWTRHRKGKTVALAEDQRSLPLDDRRVRGEHTATQFLRRAGHRRCSPVRRPAVAGGRLQCCR